MGSAELAATTHMSERGAGWFDYNPGYFVELQDLSSERNADVGLGTSTLTNVEVVYLEAEGALYDLATGRLHYFNGHNSTKFTISENPTVVLLSEAQTDLDPLPSLEASTSRVAMDLLLAADEDLSVEFFGNIRGDFVLTTKISADHGHSVTRGFSNSFDLQDSTVTESLLTLAGDNANPDQLANIDTLLATDNFLDGVGNDIYLGNGVEKVINSGYQVTDIVKFDGARENYRIEFGRLDSDGRILGLSTEASANLSDFQGSPNAAYTRVIDLRSDEDGGRGDNYLFDIGRVHFVGSNEWVGLRSEVWDDNTLGVTSHNPNEHFSVFDEASINQAFDNGTLTRLELRYYARTLDQLEDGVVGVQGRYEPSMGVNLDYNDRDRLRIEDYSSGYNLSQGWASFDDQGRFILDAQGNVVLYQAGEQPQTGTLKQVLLIDVPAGGLIAVDGFHQIQFTDAEFDIQARYTSWANDTWNINYTDANGDHAVADDVFTEGRIEMGDLGGRVDLSETEMQDFVALAESDQQGAQMLAYGVNDGAGDDVIKLHSTDYHQSVWLSAGDDFVHFTGTQNLEPFEALYSEEVKLDVASERFDMRVAHILLDDNGEPVTRLNGKVWFVSSDMSNAVQAVVLTDKLSSSSDAYLGQKIIVGAREIRFSDTRIELGGELREEDWNDDGVVDMVVQRGSNLGEVLSFRASDGEMRDRLEGFGGDDVLVGGSGGDELEGGAGNDLLVGGENGTTDNSWDNLTGRQCGI